MSEIRLLPASTELNSSTQEINGQSTSSAANQARVLSARTISRDGSSYPNDNYVWSVSVGEDGAFNFYAAPKSGWSANSTAWQQSSAQQQATGSVGSFNAMAAQDAVSQYSLYASMPMSAGYVHAVDLYA